MAENIAEEMMVLAKAAEKAKNSGQFMQAVNLYTKAGQIANRIAQSNSRDMAMYQQFSMNAKNCFDQAKLCRDLSEGKEPRMMRQAPPSDGSVSISRDNRSSNRGSNGGTSDDDKYAQNAENLVEEIDADNLVTFADVAGLNEVKRIINDRVLAPLQYPELAKLYNIKPGAMVLLYGLPGTGKTLMAQAIAGEVKAKFYRIPCDKVISKYVGESSQKLQAVFDSAYNTEKCILFFDEFDSVAAKRTDSDSGGSQESNRFMATFLQNIGGCKKSSVNKLMLIVAATNRPWAIDSAMLRGQRIDNQVYIDLPDKKGRAFIIKKALKGAPRSQDFSLREMVDLTEGYGGADIKTVCENMLAKVFGKSIVTKSKQPISRADYYEALVGQNGQVKHPSGYKDEERVRFEEYAAMQYGGFKHDDGEFTPEDDFN